MDLHPSKFSHLIQVQETDIDEMGHVNNVVYLRWVQEVATAALQNQYKWVVLRHEINYLKPAFRNNTIKGFTWVGDYQGAKFERFVSLYNSETNTLLAEAKTIWCLIDAQTFRPKRIEENIWSIL